VISYLSYSFVALTAASLGAFAGDATDVARLLAVPALIVGVVLGLECTRDEVEP
jgi:hypothetical protein